MGTINLIKDISEFIGTLFLEKTNKYILKYFQDMLIGLLGNRSPLISNISRFLDEVTKLKHTEKRISKHTDSKNIEWEDIKLRMLELASRMVQMDDVIAFDPGDIIKNYATEMEDLYTVHDGSKNICGLGYEEFAVEAVQYRNEHQFHIPLWQMICNAKRDEYVSQNFQIILCIKTIVEHLGEKGIWTFDRGHDRSRILEVIFTTLSRWIMRVKENRIVLWNNKKAKIDDIVKQMDLSKVSRRLTYPKITGEIFLAWEKITPTINGKSKDVFLIVAHDKRNESPVLLYTNIDVQSADDAIIVFGYYLLRWGKEEGFRFTKSFLNLEDIRTMSFASVQNLSFLIFLVYFFVTCFYRDNTEIIEQLCEENLKNFRHIKEIKFKYYRVGQLMRVLLWKQYNKNLGALMATEVK